VSKTATSHSVCLFAAFAIATSGCLSTSHEVPRQELRRLAEQDPAHRGEAVRVVQLYANQAHEPPPDRGPRAGASVHVHVSGGARTRRAPPRESRQQPAQRDHRQQEPAQRDHRQQEPAQRDHRQQEPAQRDHRQAESETQSQQGSSQTSPRRASSRDGEAADSAASARRLLIAAGVVAGALAISRGSRYDGWVDLADDHPIHLVGPRGEYDWVPLSQLSLDDATWARRAYIRPDDGRIQRLGRRPLHRNKWTYSFLLGGGLVPVLDASPASGFLGRFDIGFFPAHEVGIGLDFAFGWTEDSQGATIYDSRTALQLQAFPFQANRLHGGFFVQGGVASLIDDGIQQRSSTGLFGGGALLQLGLTTTLALTARAGMTRAHGENLGDFTVGISVY
jgi:hypothetical protein